jgi:hypothetical protein
VGWRLWVDHPYITALASGCTLLLIAGAVVDAHFRRREARRWHGLGFVAAGELASIQYDTAIAMAALVGRGDRYLLRSDVEFHLAFARERAGELLGPAASAPADGIDDVDLHDRLAILVADETWRRSCSQTLRVTRSHLVDAVSRWTGTFAILNDDQQFNRVARTVAIMDLITALHMSLTAIGPLGELADADTHDFATFAGQWADLLEAVNTELDFWNERRRVHTRVELPTRGETPTHREPLPAER